MPVTSREFQVFVKPAGASCNMACSYCYYLEKGRLYGQKTSPKMNADTIEKYIRQHIEASTEPVITFSWHGGEPMLAGLDFYKNVVQLQRRYKPASSVIVNGIQTNGTLIDEEWCRFMAQEKFVVGLSMDGPGMFHNLNRCGKDGKGSFEKVMRGYRLLQQHNIVTEILCVVHAENVKHPLEVYRFFREMGSKYLTFLPLVERQKGSATGVSSRSVPSEAFGFFMGEIFDEWSAHDIGAVKVQLFEEATRVAFGQGHTLCIFRETCGGVPVVEHNGDFYSCDHYVDDAHRLGNICKTPLVSMLDSKAQKAFGGFKHDSLPRYCRDCEVLPMCNGECPRNRFLLTPDGESGLNYLCRGYKYFFNHCKPFVSAVSQAWQQEQRRQLMRNPLYLASIGRNDPCPCGSGMKYKNCCLNRQR